MEHVVTARPPVGFNRGRPVLACLAYKAIVHWGMIEVERANVQERIMEHMLEAAKTDDVGMRCYWLSNAAHIHFLVRGQTARICSHLGHQLPPLFSVSIASCRECIGTSRTLLCLRSCLICMRISMSLQSIRGPSCIDTTISKTSLPMQIEKLYLILRDGLKEDINNCLNLLLQVGGNGR